MPAIKQTSFAGGELAPTLYGRTDFAKYGSGLKTCRNFFISRHGAAVSRPGTQYVAAVKTATLATRLIPFISSDGEAYVLEFGDNYVRVYQDGARVGTVELATPWVYSDLFHIKFAQSGDVLTVTHHDRTPKEITRTSHLVWAIADVDFDVPEYDGTTPFIISRVSVPPEDEAGNPISGPPQADLPARAWKWRVTVTRERRNGSKYETAPRDVTHSTAAGSIPATAASALGPVIQLGPEFPLSLMFRTAALQSADADRIVATNVYRGRENVYGYIGSALGDQSTDEGGYLRDEGQEPDYTRQPPQGRNPFKVYDGQETLLRTEQPTACGYYEQRQVFAGTVERPGRAWVSATNDFLNFDQKGADGTNTRAIGVVNSDSTEVEAASRKREEIRSILGLDSLLLFTNSSIWAVRSDGAMGPINVPAARVQSEVGSSWRDPLVVGDSVLYVRSKGTGVRDLAYSNDRQGYAGGDLSILAEHIFRGYTISDWTYAEDPWSLVWCVRSDGTLLSLTYDRTQEVWAWAAHTLGGDGAVESVCAVPEGTEDAVYLVVRRVVDGATVRYIERLTSRLIDEAENAVCLDASITQANGTPFTAVTGLSHIEGAEVYALADGAVQGPFTVSAGAITLTEEATRAHVGLRYDCELETLDVPNLPADKKVKITEVCLRVEASRGGWTGQASGLWAGESSATVNEWQQRIVATSYDEIPLETGKVRITARGSYNDNGRVVVQQLDPLPLTVLEITRIVDFGG